MSLLIKSVKATQDLEDKICHYCAKTRCLVHFEISPIFQKLPKADFVQFPSRGRISLSCFTTDWTNPFIVIYPRWQLYNPTW